MSKHPASRRFSPLLLLALLLAGCGGGGTNGGGSGSSPSPAPAAPLSVSATAPSGLTATLAEDRSTVPVGGSVTYTLTLKNGTGQPITIITGGSVPFSSVFTPVGGSLAITSPSGATAYPTPIETTTPGGTVGTPVTLAPGQSASGTLGPVSVFATPGTYAATTSFDASVTATSPTTVGPLTVTVQ